MVTSSKATNQDMGRLASYKSRYRPAEALRPSSADVVKLALERLHMTQAQLARQLETDASVVCAWKNGRRDIGTKFLKKLAVLLMLGPRVFAVDVRTSHKRRAASRVMYPQIADVRLPENSAESTGLRRYEVARGSEGGIES